MEILKALGAVILAILLIRYGWNSVKNDPIAKKIKDADPDQNLRKVSDWDDDITAYFIRVISILLILYGLFLLYNQF
ncbi:MAG: hypothetical protein WBM53_00810 [Maribacter sp.]